MELRRDDLDGGNPFDWGRTSSDYAKYRDIYPPVFYEKLAGHGLGVKGQACLDVGTGTGVIPRNMYKFGADWTGIDISENQIEMARMLSEKKSMKIKYQTVAVEDVAYPEESFDVITACQCFVYFDKARALPNLARMLKKDGLFVVLFMSWLPDRHELTRLSKESVERANPSWNGGEGIFDEPMKFEDIVYDYFDEAFHEEYYADVEFSPEKWHGRVKSCRGMGASMPPEKIARWEKEHLAILKKYMPTTMNIPHFIQCTALRPKSR
ncbi:MAG: class I SAM-dependent methyltransferase [Treponemataceae bacterium]|nr:class I SAM-dependent methyltransferase [Treponemataceae bacterium]